MTVFTFLHFFFINQLNCILSNKEQQCCCFFFYLLCCCFKYLCSFSPRLSFFACSIDKNQPVMWNFKMLKIPIKVKEAINFFKLSLSKYFSNSNVKSRKQVLSNSIILCANFKISPESREAWWKGLLHSIITLSKLSNMLHFYTEEERKQIPQEAKYWNYSLIEYKQF